jgi:LDH2 family malate/lactate/ureidoglycolate dehydrogenase
MAENKKRVPVEEMRTWITKIFTEAGETQDHSALVADNLLEAEMRGHISHGVDRIPFYVQKVHGGGFKKNANMRILKEKASGFTLDADGGIGVVAGRMAMEECCKRAKTTGACFAVVRNGNHFGIDGYYTLMALKHDMIGLSFCNTSPNMHIWGGADKVLGTNPISVSLPSNLEAPFYFDAATAVAAKGKVVVARDQGIKEVPDTWGVDKDGKVTTDPVQIITGGSVSPFGAYKGSHLSLLIDLLCGALAGSAFNMDTKELMSDWEHPQNVGFLFGALNVEAFTDLKLFKDLVTNQVKRLKASRKAVGFDEILMPGEKEYRNRQDCLKNGVPLNPGVLQKVEAACKKVGVCGVPAGWL